MHVQFLPHNVDPCLITCNKVGTHKQSKDSKVDDLNGWWILVAVICPEGGATDAVITEADSEDTNDNPSQATNLSSSTVTY